MDQEFVDQCSEVACRSYIPEDSARDLFLKVYDLMVFASNVDRLKAIQMLIDVYDMREFV